MKKIGRLIAAAATAALLAALPTSVDAANRRIRIKPAEFQPFTSHQADRRSSVMNQGSSGPVLFWKTLDIPLGATIRGISHRRFALSANATIVAGTGRSGHRQVR